MTNLSSSASSKALSLANYEEEFKFLNNSNYKSKGYPISVEYFGKIIKVMGNSELLSHIETKSGDGKEWATHIWKLLHLEKCFRKSKEFTMDIAIDIFFQHFESIKKQGFDVNAVVSGNGNTALSWATERTSPAIITALIKAGVTAKCVFAPYADPFQRIFSSKESEELVDQSIDILAKSGFDPNVRLLPMCTNNETLVTPLWIASKSHSSHVIRSLVKAKADINIEIHHPEGSTALQAALISDSKFDDDPEKLSTVKTLIELGANIFIEKGKGKTVADMLNKDIHFEKEKVDVFLDNIIFTINAHVELSKLEYFPKVITNIVFEYLCSPEDESDKVHFLAIITLGLKNRAKALLDCD